MIKLIGPNDDDAVQDFLRRQINVLSDVLVNHDGNLEVLTSLPEKESMSLTADKDGILTSYEIFRVQMKLDYIKKLYEIIMSKNDV